MGRFIRRRNVERYWRLLDRVSNESDRQRILELLVQERQKQKDAGDLIYLGSGLIKSTIRERRRDKQRLGNFARAYRSALQSA